MRNYWLIFFTFGGRKGCKIILARRSRKKGATIKAAFLFLLIIPK